MFVKIPEPILIHLTKSPTILDFCLSLFSLALCFRDFGTLRSALCLTPPSFSSHDSAVPLHYLNYLSFFLNSLNDLSIPDPCRDDVVQHHGAMTLFIIFLLPKFPSPPPIFECLLHTWSPAYPGSSSSNTNLLPSYNTPPLQPRWAVLWSLILQKLMTAFIILKSSTSECTCLPSNLTNPASPQWPIVHMHCT